MLARLHLLLPCLAAGLFLLPLPDPVSSQEAEWNAPRTTELVERAREARTERRGDEDLRSYSADARGFVYFYIDRGDRDDPLLVKTDQLALEVYWRSPDQIRQRIVGRRDEARLPTNIQYHLDHLMVVQDDFGDRIRLGDGDEIEDVVHPVSPASDRIYDFRLSDSLTLTLPGPEEAVRVYEVQVRPKDPDSPGFVGSVFLDRGTASIVRMRFTFTPSSYVDPYLDHIRVSLDNGLWLGRFWLPHRQEVEIRREMPQLDLRAGTVIRARYEIRDYEFNPPLPDEFFDGPTLTVLPRDLRESFPFEEDLYARIDRDGLASPEDFRTLRRDALDAMGRRSLTGLRRFRLHLPSASSGLRYNRAEGLFVGGGFSLQPDPSLKLEALGGYAFARGKPGATVRLTGGSLLPETGLQATVHQIRDIGPLAATSGVANTFSSLLLETDHLDPFFASGISIHHGAGIGARARIRGALRWEEQRSARNRVGGQPDGSSLRPVRPVEEGRETAVDLRISTGRHPTGLLGEAEVSFARFQDEGYASIQGRLGWERRWLNRETGLRADLHGGLTSAGAPPQRLYLLGGRGTLPGYPFRSFTGDRFWLLDLELSKGMASPWLNARGFASVGSTRLRHGEIPDSWNAFVTPMPLFSAGVGAGLFWDVLHIRAGRGLNGGAWEWTVSVNRRFWEFL